ncbi:MAG: hypothetical protein FJW69_08745 [Actinobacteria bacterium]|nr:hypothetical protein [Actinomycetota bacterium]
MSEISLEVLKKYEQENLFKLAPFFKDGGYLAGGTALMLQLYFRRSYDFDLFFGYEIPERFLRNASEIYRKNIKILINSRDELTFISPDKVKISFIYFPFKRKYKIIDYESIRISDFKDIASDKAYVIGRRPQYRDYIDLYIIMKSGFGLDKIIKDSREKFGGEFSEKLFLSQLVYYEDISDYTIEFTRDFAGKDDVKSFFDNQIRQYYK